MEIFKENATEQTTDHAGAIIGFKTQRGEQVHARIASSFISFEQAARNMKELGNDNLEQIKQKGQKAWNQVLGKIGSGRRKPRSIPHFLLLLIPFVTFPPKILRTGRSRKTCSLQPL